MFQGKKWEEEKEKREGETARMTERFEGILAKKEVACLERSNVKVERINILMAATEIGSTLKRRKRSSKSGVLSLPPLWRIPIC